MNRRTFQLAVLSIFLGLAVGVLLPHLRQGEWRQWLTAAKQAEEIIPAEGEVKSDAFSVRLLQAALQTPEYPLDFVCPAATTAALRHLKSLCKGETEKQIATLGLSQTESATGSITLQAAMEESLPRAEGDLPILLLPFRSDYPEALSLFNSFFGFPAANSANTSKDTRLFMAVRTEIGCRFRLPFYAKDSKVGDFDNADGGMPAVRLLRRCGRFRVAEAEDGSWKAAALLLETPANAPTAALVVVLPQGKVRDFALAMDADTMTAIRRALVEATPEEVNVELPALNIAVNMHNAEPLLRALGLTAPFDIRTADFSPLTKETVALNAVAESLSCVLAEEERKPKSAPSPDSAAGAFSLTRPFLWFVGDLTTGAPPAVLGIVENL